MANTSMTGLSDDMIHVARTAFITLEIVGSHIMVPILVATFAFCKLERCKYLINLCITGIFAGVVYSLLYYAGQSNSNEITPLCVVQSAMVFALPPMIAAALLVVTFNLSSDLQTIVNPKPPTPHSLTRTALLILFPYVVFFAFMVPGAVIAMADESLGGISHRHIFYCSVMHGQYSTAAGLAAAFLMTVGIYLSVKILVITIKHCVVIRRSRFGYGSQLSNVARVLIFTILVCIAYSLAIVELITERTLEADLVIAALPVALGVLYGSSRDVWMTWLRRRAAPDEAPPFEIDPELGQTKERWVI